MAHRTDPFWSSVPRRALRAVLELNAVWGAGLNGCDAEAMAECLVEATQPALRGCGE